MNKFAFKNRLFLTYAAVVVVVVAIFSAVLVFVLRGNNRATELLHQREIYKGNLLELENVLEQMGNLADRVASNNEIMNRFIGLGGDGDFDNYFAVNLVDAIETGSLLSSINGAENFAARISVFNQLGDYISTGTLYEDADTIAAVLEGLDYFGLTERILGGNEKSLLLDFHEDFWSSNKDVRLISLYKALSSYTSTVYGLVDVQVSANIFDKQEFWSLDAGGDYFLIGRDGDIIYPFVEDGRISEIGSLVHDSVIWGNREISTFELRENGENVIMLASRVYPSDWILLKRIPAGLLQKPYTVSYAIIISASAVLLILLIIVVYYLSARLTRPLGRLTGAVSGVNLQNMNNTISEMETEYFVAEFNALNNAFKAMLNRLNTSIAVEIRANMRALQSQMNPHFLYNMLSVIVESSEEEGAERTVSMCMKLSSMLRYIADYNGDNTSLEDELAHTRNYLDLMKERYEELFSYEIISDGDAGGIYVPRLIVQPLAENCFSHGFKACRPPWFIRVELFVTGGRWSLRVSDNGGGMTDEVIADIYSRFEKYRFDMSGGYAALKLGGMGLVNTLMRLSLYYGDAYEFTIRNGPDGGSIIEIGGTL